MKKDNFKTDVVFRVWNNQNFAAHRIIALFPHEAWDLNGNVVSYEHVGQHAAADYYHCIKASHPATESEYKPLFDELTDIGYDLNVVKRQTRSKYMESYNNAKGV